MSRFVTTEALICENCKKELDPDNQELWEVVDYDSEVTGYDGHYNWFQEWVDIKCLPCGHINAITSGWVVDPDDERY